MIWMDTSIWILCLITLHLDVEHCQNPVLDLTPQKIGFRIYILKGLFENFTQMDQ